MLNCLSAKKIFCGDLNILEPNYVPHYPFFEDWEYDFYRVLDKYQLDDAFRHLNPNSQEYSRVGEMRMAVDTITVLFSLISYLQFALAIICISRGLKS